MTQFSFSRSNCSLRAIKITSSKFWVDCPDYFKLQRFFGIFIEIPVTEIILVIDPFL